MTEAPICVVVTAVGGYGFQILNALRRAQNRYVIVGCDMAERCAQYSLCDHFVRMPAARSADYMQALKTVVRHFDARAVFPGSEQELQVLGEHADELRARGVMLPVCPADVLAICTDKQKTAAWLRAHGFASPRCAALDSEEDIGRIDYFPVVVKPISGSAGSRNTFIAQSADELVHLARYVVATGDRFLVQEYVGVPELEFTVGVLNDLDGNFLDAIALRRYLSGALHVRASVQNSTGRRDLGRRLVISSGVSHGEIGGFPQVTETCRAISSALRARGPINIQCRLVDGIVYPFEINPRFSGTTGLRAMVGFNEPERLIDIHVRGQVSRPPPYRQGVIVRSLAETLLDGPPAPSWTTLAN